jgi:L-2-hydroxyglutarate oxidase LhgO
LEQADITIIGAGVIGLAIAAELAEPKSNVFILEKNQRHGQGISSRNSEVIHAGIYYPEGSLKAELCVSGNRMIYEIAARNAIRHQKTGKLIVATRREDIFELERLLSQGRQNHVSGLKMLTEKQMVRMEPGVRALAALYSPDTGIISAHDLMDFYLARAQAMGAHLICRTQVTRIEKERSAWRIFARNDREDFSFSSSLVINAAGLSSDTIGGFAGADYQLHYCKGDYCSISGVKPGMVSRLIYPAPPVNHAGLGVHLTLDLNGRLKLGPDAAYIARTEDYGVEAGKAPLFYEQAVRFLPFLKPENVHPDMAGIRPKLQGPENAFADFVIRQDAPGFINLVGIESPGLTASPAIARYVAKMLSHFSSNLLP